MKTKLNIILVVALFVFSLAFVLAAQGNGNGEKVINSATCADEGDYIYNNITEGSTECCEGLVSKLVTGASPSVIGRCVEIEQVCCKTTPVVLNATSSYLFMDESDCNSTGLVGITKEIVDDEFCETEEYENETEIEDENEGGDGYGKQKRVQVISQYQEQIRAGNYTLANGNKIQLMNNGSRTRLKIKNVEAVLGINISTENGNQTKLKAQLSNGRNAEVKVMPNTASERALERLRLKVCNESNGCQIVLKEVGKGNNTNVSYEIQIQRHSRILGIFSKKMKVTAEVDAENPDAKVKIHKPWWAFLAYEPEEKGE